jgi:hypothetical protein
LDINRPGASKPSTSESETVNNYCRYQWRTVVSLSYKDTSSPMKIELIILKGWPLFMRTI